MPDFTTALAQSRVLGFLHGERILALVGVHADRVVADIAVMRSIADSWSVEIAEGDQLDAIGSILQLAREGWDDDRYRVLLQMQAQILLSSTGSTAVLERVVEIWSGDPPLLYAEPESGLGAEVTILAGLDVTDYAPLLVFLRKAKAAGVRLTLAVVPAADPLFLNYTPEDPVVDAADLNYTPETPVATAGALSYPHTI